MKKRTKTNQVVEETKNKPLFFVFTCVKEGRPFIKRLFDSLIKQTKKNFVHFIYEDGSKDSICDLIEEYKKRVSQSNSPYEVIYEYNPRNIGLNRSTSYCINKCNCPYFIWIDCDNWVDEHFFEELEKQVKRRSNDIVFRTNTLMIDDKTLKPVLLKRKIPKIDKHPLLDIVFRFYKYSFFAVNYNMLTKVCKKIELIDDKRFFNDKQVLFLASHINDTFSYTKRALGSALIRVDSEYLSNKEEELDLKFDDLLNNYDIKPKYNYKELEQAKIYSKESYKCYEKKMYNEAIELLIKKRRLLKKNDVPYWHLYLGGCDFKRLFFYKALILLERLKKCLKK